MEYMDRELMDKLLKKLGLCDLLIEALQESIKILEERIKCLTREFEHNDKHIDVLEKLLDEYQQIESSYHKQYLN